MKESDSYIMHTTIDIENWQPIADAPHPAWTNTTCERVLWVRYNANAERYEVSGENSMVDTAVTRDEAIARAHSFMATNPTVSAML
jgi:hypothetical protein